MRIVFMGTPDFARGPLERLYNDGHDIAAVFTQPDKPRNRGMKVAPCPVGELAAERGTPVFQPATLRDGTALKILSELQCELIAVVAYGKLLPLDVLELPPLGCVNIHGSLLPKYRGAAPIQRAVINGERETGVTSIYMAEEMDAGDILYTRKTAIGDDETAGELFDRLGILAAELLSETVDAISRGSAVGIPQNHEEATFAPPLRKEASAIDWRDCAEVIRNKVRGFNPRPTATAEFGGVTYKVFSAAAGERKAGTVPGRIIAAGNEGLAVECGDGTVIIKELQAPGGKRMSAADYLRGHKLMRSAERKESEVRSQKSE